MECSDSAPEISTEPCKRNVEHQTQVMQQNIRLIKALGGQSDVPSVEDESINKEKKYSWDRHKCSTAPA